MSELVTKASAICIYSTPAARNCVYFQAVANQVWFFLRRSEGGRKMWASISAIWYQKYNQPVGPRDGMCACCLCGGAPEVRVCGRQRAWLLPDCARVWLNAVCYHARVLQWRYWLAEIVVQTDTRETRHSSGLFIPQGMRAFSELLEH